MISSRRAGVGVLRIPTVLRRRKLAAGLVRLDNRLVTCRPFSSNHFLQDLSAMKNSILDEGFDIKELGYSPPNPRPISAKFSPDISFNSFDADGICSRSLLEELIQEGNDADNPNGLNIADIAYLKRLVKSDPKAQTKRPINDFDFVPQPSDTFDLVIRQIRLEEEMYDEAIAEQQSITKMLQGLGEGASQKRVQNHILRWYSPLLNAINEAIDNIRRDPASSLLSMNSGAYMLLLDPAKQTIITLHTTINLLLKNNNVVKVSDLALRIGEALEMEVNIEKKKSSLQAWQIETVKKALSGKIKNNSRLFNKMRDAVASETWAKTGAAAIGGELLRMLIETAVSNEAPALRHYKRKLPDSLGYQGMVSMEPELFLSLSVSESLSVPRYLPMLVMPRPWNNKSPKATCFLRLHCPLVRTQSNLSSQAINEGNMNRVLECLDYLGSIPWRINEPVYRVIVELYEKGIVVGDIPSKSDLPAPSPEEAIRVPKMPSLSYVHKASTEQQRAERYQRVKELLDKYPPDDPYWKTPAFDEAYYKVLKRRAQMKNADLKSLRCDLDLKLNIAKRFLTEKMYFPCNLDFRGRVYPVPPNLNHIGSDLCRSLLLFDKAEPLGDAGLRWLKVHICNLFGNNKISLEDRERWADQHIDKIFASGTSPLADDENSRWWMSAESPFEALAACMEIVAAINSGDPATFMSRLPVHQDGSCNGLQHYSALGLDLDGAHAVNLCASDVPQDVYSKVLDIVNKKIDRDAATDGDYAEIARKVQGIVDRKVIKQSVMTSVYGVTQRGATMQIYDRLLEKFAEEEELTLEQEKLILPYARYVSELTLDSLGELFNSADAIMAWLGKCAKLVALNGQSMSWVSPLGLPIIQPYRRFRVQVVSTLLQEISLAVDDDLLPVSAKKQVSAFPPNFVHSLDATHMALTALKMKEMGLSFASVHDSYWTHACHIPTMNKVLRESFVELYSLPILESLLESLTFRFPDIEFPPIPARGRLKLESVKDSKYFFH